MYNGGSNRKIFLREHWKLSWDFQGELLGELHHKLPWICGVMEALGAINHSVMKQKESEGEW